MKIVRIIIIGHYLTVISTHIFKSEKFKTIEEGYFNTKDNEKLEKWVQTILRIIRKR